MLKPVGLLLLLLLLEPVRFVAAEEVGASGRGEQELRALIAKAVAAADYDTAAEYKEELEKLHLEDVGSSATSELAVSELAALDSIEAQLERQQASLEPKSCADRIVAKTHRRSPFAVAQEPAWHLAGQRVGVTAGNVMSNRPWVADWSKHEGVCNQTRCNMAGFMPTATTRELFDSPGIMALERCWALGADLEGARGWAGSVTGALGTPPLVCTDQTNEHLRDPVKLLKILDAFRQPTVVMATHGDSLVRAQHLVRFGQNLAEVANWALVLRHKMLHSLWAHNANDHGALNKGLVVLLRRETNATELELRKLRDFPIGLSTGSGGYRAVLQRREQRTAWGGGQDCLLLVNAGGNYGGRAAVRRMAREHWQAFALIAGGAAVEEECGAGEMTDQGYVDLVARSAFTLSWPGLGWDCFRTWEALYLGSIPVLKKTGGALDRLYDGLPVLYVDGWEQVTRQLLLDTLQNFSTRTFNFDKLTQQWWNDQIMHS
jgi:hypothetical protein